MDRLEAIRSAVVGAVTPLGTERLPLSAAARRWLSGPTVAARDVPPYACSAMDGYALRACDAPRPVRLRVTRTIFAGEEPGSAIGSGEAVRIYTGAPLPPAADSVVREEATRGAGAEVEIHEPVRPGENVRIAGEDVARGAVALEDGTFVGARQLALLTSIGVEQLVVVRRLRVALLSTGDELVLGRTANSNGAAIGEALRGIGAEVRGRVVGDDPEATTAAIADGLASSDAVVTIGGVSIGARDHVPSAVDRLRGEVRVHGVPMKPGKPFLFALVEGKPLFGLPGSPSACLVAFEVFARPALLRMAGAARPFRRAVHVPVAESVSGRPGRARFLWARLEEDGRARPIGRDAAQVRGPALADTLLYLAEGVGEVAEGEPVLAWLVGDDGP